MRPGREFRVFCKRLCPLILIGTALAVHAQIKTLKPGWNLFSPQQDIQLGKEAATQVHQKMLVVHNAEVDAYLNAMLDRLKQAPHAGQLSGTTFPFTISLVSDKNINAFALPGGPLFIHSALILAADNEAQLAGVIGHEMSHVVLRHSTNQVSKQNILQIPMALAGAVAGNGILGQMEKAGINVLAAGAMLTYSRGDESQADYNGALIASEAGYNPLEMAHFFEKLEAQTGKQGKLAQFLSDHPNPGNRVGAVEDEIQHMPQHSYTSDSGRYAHIKDIVAKLPPPATPAAGPGANSAMPGAPPSGRLREYRGGSFALSYPDNWQVMGDPQSNPLTIAPAGGVTQGQKGNAIGYGVQVSYYFPAGNTLDLNRDTNALVQQLMQQNTEMRITKSSAAAQVGGQRGLVTTMASSSPFQGQSELDILVTVARPEGLFYMIFISPQSEAAQLEGTIRDVLASVRFQ